MYLSAADGMLGGMHHVVARPRSPALQPFVKSFHYHEAEFPFGLERILPSGQAHVMVNLAEDEFRTYSGDGCGKVNRMRGAILAGPHSQSTVMDTREFQWLIAIEFKLGGAAPFFALPLNEVCDQAVDMDHLWGLDGKLLREQLLSVPTPQAKFEVLECMLVGHFRSPLPAAMKCAVSLLNRGVPVAATTEHLGILPKTFVRHFREHIGIAPKRFARVRRMQRIVKELRAKADIDWSSMAADHGFTDQAHFIHDFRDITGLTPTAYKPHSPQRGNHVPIAAKAG
jgi:AraC-like DNA-binding protein